MMSSNSNEILKQMSELWEEWGEIYSLYVQVLGQYFYKEIYYLK